MLKTALRNLLAHKARQIMTLLAVCLGVAFVSGTLVFADSTAEAHRAAASKSFADIAVSVTAKEPHRGPPHTSRPARSTTRSRGNWPPYPVSAPCARRPTVRPR